MTDYFDMTITPVNETAKPVDIALATHPRPAVRALLELGLNDAETAGRRCREAAEWHRTQAVVRDELARIADEEAVDLRKRLEALR